MSILKQHSSYGEDNNYYSNGQYNYRATKNEVKASGSKAIRDDYDGGDKENGYHTDNASSAAGLADNSKNNNDATTRSVSGGNASFSQLYAYTDANVRRAKNDNDDSIIRNMQNSANQFHNSSKASTTLSLKVPR